MIDQQLPYNIEAEESVLGSIIIDPENSVLVARRVLKSEDFYIIKNQWIYAALLRLKSNHQPIDFVTVCDELTKRNQLSEIGGPSYISHLFNIVPTALHCAGYAEIVVAAAIDRRLIQAASTIAQLAYNNDVLHADKIAQSMRAIKGAQPDQDGHVRLIVDVAAELTDDIEQWHAHQIGADDVRGLTTGFASIDKLTGGMQLGEQTVLIGRTGMGKSALGFQIALSVAEQGYPALIVSLEMSRKPVLYRLIAHRIGVTWQNLQRGWVNDEAWEKIYIELARLESLPLYIVDKPRRTLPQIESYIAGIERLALVVVDHLRLVSDRRMKDESEVTRLGRVSMSLRDMAREYGCHNLLIAQMNRSADTRDEKRPTLSDIRQSGEIEENADSVWGMYREDYYNKQSLNKGCVEIWPLKNRNGDTNTPAELRFIAEYTHFERMEYKQL